MIRNGVVLSVLLMQIPAAGCTQGQQSQVHGPDGIPVVELGGGPTTVIMLHGGPAVTHRYLRPEWDWLADVARVVYFDQRGCGSSARTDSVTWQQLVSDLDHIVRSARKLGSVVVAGASWGSSLALLYAAAHPESLDALILTGVPSPEVGFPRLATSAWKEIPIPDDTLRIRRGPTGVDSVLLIRRAQLDVAGMPAVRDSLDVVSNPGNMHPIIASRIGMDCPRTRASIWWSMRDTGPLPSEFSDIQLPTLIINGANPVQGVGDGSRFLDSIMPSSTVSTISGAGHDPWLEQRDKFFPEVRRFLQKQGLVPEGV